MLSSLADFQHFKNGSLFRLALFLFMAFLGGCQTPPDPRSLPHRPAEAAFIPASTQIALSDGSTAPVRLYPATAPQRGVILAFHGFGDSRDAWEIMAPTLNRAGFLIVAPDVRSFGEFPVKGNWSTTGRMIADAAEEARWCQQRWPGQPLYLMGESMGGAIALLTSTILPAPHPDGLILLAPAIMTIGEPWQTLLEGWNLITPQAHLTGAHMPGHHVATGNLRALRRMFFDPLTRHGTTVHALHGLTHLMDRALKQAPYVQTPTLLIWGARDQFVPASATRRLIQQAPPSMFRLDELPRGYHLITREPHDRPAKDIIAWIREPGHFLPSGGDSAATMWLWLEQTR
ncbi:lysophospholipase [Bombella sp. TMW 2.2543]|uniref:Lysophospholipase n=1 Tax=Bombella pluederhausensis TaxID=2967336 RepID=A0ABT3WDX9_9PROT|nr:alpha/beta fold hydrolase [Bombella pluederhausensis]MCX5617305.1 lysophospholipase [Bombella pluederhausensis]